MEGNKKKWRILFCRLVLPFVLALKAHGEEEFETKDYHGINTNTMLEEATIGVGHYMTSLVLNHQTTTRGAEEPMIIVYVNLIKR